MALIYANAVNKRMKEPLSKPKKKSSCPFRDESPLSMREDRKRSTSTEPTPTRKRSSQFKQDCFAAGESEKEHKHRPIQRSKTSCGDILQKIEEENQRKCSHPAMMQSSSTSQSLATSSSESKRAMAKTNLIQKYNLEHKIDKRSRSSGERRRSISLDAEQWKDEMDSEREACRKGSAFQKMKRKFSKWKMT